MAQRGIHEYCAKKILAKNLPNYLKAFKYPGKVALVTPDASLDTLSKTNSWLRKQKLVVKPDQLFGKRGKHKLLLLDASFSQANKWLKEHMNKTVTIGKTRGKLTHFLVEPYVPHKEEYYLAIKTEPGGDSIYFSTVGGVDIEENWDNVTTIKIPTLGKIEDVDLKKELSKVPAKTRKTVSQFIKALYSLFRDLNFTYLEINPLTFRGSSIIPLDLVAKLDDTAEFESSKSWGKVEFPPPLGRRMTREEQYIKNLDEKTGASLKLTILNQKGRIWTMVAGGGASVIYTDTISDLGFGNELANYGEYSGNPSEEFTYLYAKTILSLMTRQKHPKGKILLIGGGIANFTDVAKTFKGIIRALGEYKNQLKKNKVRIYVRRGGPNYQEGLEQMKELGKTLGVPIQVYGPETHMTKIVSLALKGNKK